MGMGSTSGLRTERDDFMIDSYVMLYDLLRCLCMNLFCQYLSERI